MLSMSEARRIAGLELNAFNFAKILPDAFEGGSLRTAGTQVHDIQGQVLFYRFPISTEHGSAGYADVAANEAMGAPLLATSTGAEWNERETFDQATAAARRKRPELEFDDVRVVAYSYPKIAVQFLKAGKEMLMLEWKSWVEVPAAAQRQRSTMEPSNFERWNLLDEMPEEVRLSNVEHFKKRMDAWNVARFDGFDFATIRRESLELPEVVIDLADACEVRFSQRSKDHHPCFELRGQQTPVWCVAASVEMLLGFYRYQYSQVRLAEELGLGTCSNPNGLPYSQVDKVVEVIESLSLGALDATMHVKPDWATFQSEIKANRPLISFIPGHSRTVAGYTRHLIRMPGKLPFRGLLVYDPWPPTDCNQPDAGGVVTRWENFDAHSYQYAYSVMLRHA